MRRSADHQEPGCGGDESPPAEPVQDKFQAMMSATAKPDLRLADFQPRSMLVTAEHFVRRARFPAIDYHNHLDSQDPGEVLEIMDSCGIERAVNITMRTGPNAFEVMERFHRAAPSRFATIAWMDWTDVQSADFIAQAVDRLERCVEHGCIGLKIWKDLGLVVTTPDGRKMRVDDERLDPLYEKASVLGVPIMFHTGDPDAFFLPIDRFNERYEELAAHPDWSFYGSVYSKQELLEQRDRVFARHPQTQFVAAHMAERPEDLAYISSLLDRFPNLLVDMSARVAELGRQPYSARGFFIKYADRILFGTDLLPSVEMYRAHFRFLETADEYFEYPSHASRQGRWNVYGLDLPGDVLEKVYRTNALRLWKS